MTSIEQQEPTDGLSVGPQVTEADREAFRKEHHNHVYGSADTPDGIFIATHRHAAEEAAVAELRKENERLSLIAKGAVGPGSQAEVCDMDRALVCGVQQWHNDNVIGGQPRGDWHYNVSPEAGARQVAIYRRAYSEHNDRLFAEIQDLRAQLAAKTAEVGAAEGADYHARGGSGDAAERPSMAD